MTATLPIIGVKQATPRFIDRGGILEAALGGADQRLDRIGSRWGVDVSLYPMQGDTARVWIARLIRGRSEKALLPFPQPGITNPFTANMTTNGAIAANAPSIALTGTSTSLLGKTLLEGQFISILINGTYYIHQVTADTPIAGAVSPFTVAALPINPATRVSIPAGSSVFLPTSQVLIHGYVKGDAAQWSIDDAKIYGLNFTIEEGR